jgi:protein-L-isoaspartate(D-aspartate) O-methyltransferase
VLAQRAGLGAGLRLTRIVITDGKEKAMTEAELAIVRRAYAKQVMVPYNTAHPRVEAAFSAVRREAFLGPGPWPLLHFSRYVTTPDDDPVYLYQDLLVGLVPERRLNNGEPAGHAKLMARADPRPGEHVVHIGAAVGYYTAILAHLVGSGGRVTAIEYDPSLAARLAANFNGQPNVRAVQGDGTKFDFDPAEVIYVNAGATRPVDLWLDRLKDGGRMILALTKDKDTAGAWFLIERCGEEFLAKGISTAGLFPCEGGRDTETERALVVALEKGGWDRVTRFYRRGDVPEEQCWLKGPDWCLAYD